MTIGKRIKEKRAEKNMTLEELSEIVGISRQTLSRYETGVIQNIPSNNIEALAKALGATPAYLMGWEEKEKTDSKEKGLNTVKIAGRNGAYVEKRLSDEQTEALLLMLNQFPESSDPRL